MRPFADSVPMLLGERQRPLVLPGLTTAPTPLAERELPLPVSMRKLEPGKRDRGISEGLEPVRRSPARPDAAMVLRHDVIQLLARSDLHMAPLDMLTAQQPQRAA